MARTSLRVVRKWRMAFDYLAKLIYKNWLNNLTWSETRPDTQKNRLHVLAAVGVWFESLRFHNVWVFTREFSTSYNLIHVTVHFQAIHASRLSLKRTADLPLLKPMLNQLSYSVGLGVSLLLFSFRGCCLFYFVANRHSKVAWQSIEKYWYTINYMASHVVWGLNE